MSTSSHSVLNLPPTPDVLGELLHSLSQPLTSLRCSLELSIDDEAEQRLESVAVALQQTEAVIGMVRLMREYLDAERGESEAFSSALAPALRSVTEDLSSIAEVRGVRLRLVGTCAAAIPLPESRLRLALQYLIASVMDAQPDGGKVMLLLGQNPTGSVLRVEGGRGRRRSKQNVTTAATLHRVRLLIATRALSSAGALVEMSEATGDVNGFILRVPLT